MLNVIVSFKPTCRCSPPTTVAPWLWNTGR